LFRLSIVASDTEQAKKLRTDLAQRGFDCLIVPNTDGALAQITGQSCGIVLMDMDDTATRSEAWELAQRVKQELNMPLIGLISRERLNGFGLSTGIDDLVIKPCDATELTFRIKRILKGREGAQSANVITCGDLVIDTSRCEVSLGASPIVLTFKEYQLLIFLANNKGKVFTRDVLLDKVWGWDYYGGDRTVDVHIRRLRSKIEDSAHTFIETVRNIGYKFKDL
jgi:DNA-binding response OmpR family regulator